METQLSLFESFDFPARPERAAPDLENPLAVQRGISFFDLPCRSLLNRCTSERMPFEWTINPYRGCEFGCTYCYARYSHEFLGLENWLDFQDKILVKRNAPAKLTGELARVRLDGKAISIGTVTDPYQPGEKEFRVTRRILEVLARARSLDLSITTKSALITRDLDLLTELASRNRLSIHVSLITLNRRLARLLEPRAPTPERRLATIRSLAGAGLRVGVFAMPVLPGLTDSENALDALVRRSSEAGASHFIAQLLFLGASAARGFLPRLQKAYPALAARYRREFARSTHLPRVAQERLSARVSELRRKYGIGAQSMPDNGRPRGERTR